MFFATTEYLLEHVIIEDDDLHGIVYASRNVASGEATAVRVIEYG